MEKEVDRELQRMRKEKHVHRPIVDEPEYRPVVEIKKYRDLVEYEMPQLEVIKKRKLVI